VIWTDCDREGEEIGFDIIDLAKSVRPNIEFFKAHFSSLSKIEIELAVNNLLKPNLRQAEAFRVNKEIDLRIGAIFTRF